MPDVAVSVELAGVPVLRPRSGKPSVGRISLYLLDTDMDENDEDDRLVCDRLYGGGPEERIRQEIVLGIGGTLTCSELGVPQVGFGTRLHIVDAQVRTTRICAVRRPPGYAPTEPGGHRRDLALQRGRERARRPRIGPLDARIVPAVVPTLIDRPRKIAICRAEEGERRDSTPRPPGPQPEKTRRIEPYSACSGDLSRSELT